MAGKISTWMGIIAIVLTGIGGFAGYIHFVAERSYYPLTDGKVVAVNQKNISDALKETKDALKKLNKKTDDLENDRLREKIRILEKRERERNLRTPRR